MFDIITFGSATMDIFIKPKNFTKIIKDKYFITGKGICFNLGSKVDIENIFFSLGGGGTNTAATFASQGFKTAYYGTVGNDIPGEKIIKELENLNIYNKFITKTNLSPTNHSIGLSVSKKEDRTMLVYRGASEYLEKKDIDWGKLKTKWLYLAPLSGKLCNLFKDIVDYGYKNKIKIAVNPGNSQLSLPLSKLKEIFKKIDILILNQEEASFLTKINYKKEKEIIKKIKEIFSGIIIITKGNKGLIVLDNKYIYKTGILKSKVLEQTGAGDAFGSGFLSGYIRSQGDIIYAIQLGSANATSCLTEIGSKSGLLKKNSKFPKIKVEKELF